MYGSECKISPARHPVEERGRDGAGAVGGPVARDLLEGPLEVIREQVLRGGDRVAHPANETCGLRLGSIGQTLRGPSRLYRSNILQENMRLKALVEIYTMHSFAQLWNLNFL